MAETDLASVLKGLQLSETAAIQIDKVTDDYVLDLTAQSNGESSMLAATSSNHSVRLFTRKNLVKTGTITGHEDVITSIRFAKTDPNILLSSSLDGTIRCWDLRTDNTKAAQIFKGSSKTNNQFTGIDINATDRVLCAGMERDKEHNVYLLFWDRRGGRLLGCYSESHEDDITQVCFHPENADRLASGSTDGLVCVYDVSQTNEDDALSLVLNSCSTVARVGWTGNNNTNIYCTTHIDTFHVWDTSQGDPVIEKTDLKETLNETGSIDYLVDHFCTDSDDTYLLGGKHNGDLNLIQLRGEEEPEVVGSLSKGHKSTVRCLHWDTRTSTLVTGGEDSLLCLWSTGERQTNSPSKLKLKTDRTVSRRKAPY